MPYVRLARVTAQDNWCPLQEAGDRIGNAHQPGFDSYLHNPPPLTFPVLANQQICQGDIVTLKDCYIAQVESVAPTGDGKNWGDVSNGAYIARAPVDTRGMSDGDETMPVNGPCSHIETFLDRGTTVGSLVGVDLRTIGKNGRSDRLLAVKRSALRTDDRSLWQRTRNISAASAPIAKKTVLGRVDEVWPNDGLDLPSPLGDGGMVVLLERSL